MESIYRGDLEVFSRIRKVKYQLWGIINSNFPSRVDLWSNHERTIKEARKYLHELREVETLMMTNIEVVMTSHDTFNSLVKNSKNHYYRFQGRYCKIILIKNPDKNFWLIHLTSVYRIKKGTA